MFEVEGPKDIVIDIRTFKNGLKSNLGMLFPQILKNYIYYVNLRTYWDYFFVSSLI